MLLPCAASIAEADARLADRLTVNALHDAVSSVPPDWADRERYLHYLTARLEPPAALCARRLNVPRV